MSWKTIKASLEKSGVSCASPKSCFQEAYRQTLIDYEKIWIDMIEMRNISVHTYKEEKAEEIYHQLPNALEAFKKLAERLKVN